jgi:hypothetical protein
MSMIRRVGDEAAACEPYTDAAEPIALEDVLALVLDDDDVIYVLFRPAVE